jgi:hypothetical protein
LSARIGTNQIDRLGQRERVELPLSSRIVVLIAIVARIIASMKNFVAQLEGHRGVLAPHRLRSLDRATDVVAG